MKKKKLFEDFESNRDNGKFHKVSDDMVQTTVWKELSLVERALYYEFKLKFTKYRDGTTNTNNIEMPRSEYSKFMNDRTFWKSIDNIIEHGFIRVVENRWNTRECTIYGFSTQWRNYGTSAFTIKLSDRRAKRPFTKEHRENVITALAKTNKNKKL